MHPAKLAPMKINDMGRDFMLGVLLVKNVIVDPKQKQTKNPAMPNAT